LIGRFLWVFGGSIKADALGSLGRNAGAFVHSVVRIGLISLCPDSDLENADMLARRPVPISDIAPSSARAGGPIFLMTD
jgi:hypothetical protein